MEFWPQILNLSWPYIETLGAEVSKKSLANNPPKLTSELGPNSPKLLKTSRINPKLPKTTRNYPDYPKLPQTNRNYLKSTAEHCRALPNTVEDCSGLPSTNNHCHILPGAKRLPRASESSCAITRSAARAYPRSKKISFI